MAEFKVKVQPSCDTRTEVATLETQLKATRQSRRNADEASNGDALNIVNGVRSVPGFGENSALCKAMGAVRKNDRKSGLARPVTNPVVTLKAAQSDAERFTAGPDHNGTASFLSRERVGFGDGCAQG